MSRGGAVNILPNTIEVDYYCAIYWSAVSTFGHIRQQTAGKRDTQQRHCRSVRYNIIEQYTKELLLDAKSILWCYRPQ